tara:strand:+ start:2492 stop:3541 length:1050 start_codon:yes stop_codon:yes gene_type:complete
MTTLVTPTKPKVELVPPKPVRIIPEVDNFYTDRRDQGQIDIFDFGEETPTVDPLIIPGQKKFQPICVFFYGRRGQGKTLGMTTVAALMKERYRRARRKNQVFSNYWTSFSDFSHPYLIDQLNEFPEWAHDGILMIDELASAFPSVRAQSTVNLLFSNLLTQIRKRRMEALFTTQFVSQVSFTVLVQTDIFVLCEQLQSGRAIKMYLFDYWGQWSGKFWKKRWPPMKEEADWVKTIWNTDRLWGHYNTSEVIASLHSDVRGEIIEQQYVFEEEPKDLTETMTEEFDNPVDRLIAEVLKTTDKIDPSGIINQLKVLGVEEVTKQNDLKPFLAKHGLVFKKINGKTWGVKDE